MSELWDQDSDTGNLRGATGQHHVCPLHHQFGRLVGRTPRVGSVRASRSQPYRHDTVFGLAPYSDALTSRQLPARLTRVCLVFPIRARFTVGRSPSGAARSELAVRGRRSGLEGSPPGDDLDQALAGQATQCGFDCSLGRVMRGGQDGHGRKLVSLVHAGQAFPQLPLNAGAGSLR